ncbi:hypothetical protein ACH5RR_032704 [Cinchona calisaya]|uniref:Uncharacterized protein n=1 Tax=Cinchona calisaya TaxID=153742 RepID=A0ABD2YM02_9GENT
MAKMLVVKRIYQKKQVQTAIDNLTSDTIQIAQSKDVSQSKVPTANMDAPGSSGAKADGVEISSMLVEPQSQFSDGIWNHTAAAALRAWASYAYHSPTHLQHALFGQYGVIREAAEPIALRSLYSCDSEGLVHTLKESRCEG